MNESGKSQMEDMNENNAGSVADNIAKIFSFLLFPLFMPLYGIVLLFSHPLFSFFPRHNVVVCYYVVIMFDILIPIVSYKLLAVLKLITSEKMLRKEDRFVPMMITAISFFCGAVMCCKCEMPLFVIDIMVAMSIVTMLTGIISIWWKISAHLTAIGGLTVAVFLVSLSTYINPVVVISVCILLSGILASARLQLKRHTWQQLVAGYLMGWFVVGSLSMIGWGKMIRSLTMMF